MTYFIQVVRFIGLVYSRLELGNQTDNDQHSSLTEDDEL